MAYALREFESTYRKGLSKVRKDRPTLVLDKRVDETVYVVEGDRSSLRSMGKLLESLGFAFVSFSSTAEYLDHIRSEGSACLILNLQERQASDPRFLRHLRITDGPPAIFVTGLCDTPSTVSAMKAGAVEVLSLPIEVERFGAAIREAFARDAKERRVFKERMELKQRLSSLTPREREVLPLVAGGLLNKQAASVLGISQVTLQIHRGQIMRKMVAASFAELVLMAAHLGLHCPASALKQYIIRPRAYGT